MKMLCFSIFFFFFLEIRFIFQSVCLSMNAYVVAAVGVFPSFFGTENILHVKIIHVYVCACVCIEKRIIGD